ncbi:MAG: large conductance mechanosensitive channel protein MscL [Clostridia bacterium]|nr:large conductance mechanosensitive channel protein MscL [Clostridia bacterium]
MKKFLKEFKEFAMKGNVLDMAVGIIIGGAFKAIVDSLIANFIQPLLDKVVPLGENGEQAPGVVDNIMRFAGSIINFVVIALVLFVIIKVANKSRNLRKKEEEAPAAPTTKECPFCFSEVPIKATRCPHCTSELQYVPEKK